MATKQEDNSPKGRAARESIAKQQREHRRRQRGTIQEALWRDADCVKLADAISSVCGAGCAIQFGYTKDGSAFVIRIVGDGEPFNEYVRPSEDIDLYLAGLAQDYAK